MNEYLFLARMRWLWAVPLWVVTVVIGVSCLANPVHAATIFFLPKTAELHIGQEYAVEVRVDSAGQGFNAAQATIQFPKDLLEVKSIDSTPSASVFNFWLDEPRYSNAEGKLTFIGGSSDGVVGSSIQILKIIFLVKGVGSGDIVMSDAAVTASDGSGTNILSVIDVARFKVVSSTGSPSVVSVPAHDAPVPIVREPVIVQQRPDRPVVSVPIYPDPNQWHNVIGDFLVSWNLSEDIAAVQSAVNQDSAFVLPDRGDPNGLFDAKAFPALGDGIWYLHVKFKNNVGWGSSTHYRIAIDTAPPSPFTIDVPAGFSTDDPSPVLQFKTEDSLSGLDYYAVSIDGVRVATSSEGGFVMPTQNPGQHTVAVRAIDHAGNVRETSVRLDILPIASPTIMSIGKDVFAGESDVTVFGASIPNTSVVLVVNDVFGEARSRERVRVGEDGYWQATMHGPFKKGTYVIQVYGEDERGAKSLIVSSDMFHIREKPVLMIGMVEVTQFWFFVGLIVVILLGFSFGWISYRSWRRLVGKRIVIAQRDVVNVFVATVKDLDTVLRNFSPRATDDPRMNETKFLLKKAKMNLEKMQKYILENIREIGD